MKQDKKEERELEPTCGCMQMLGFKTCIECIDYQKKYVRAVRMSYGIQKAFGKEDPDEPMEEAIGDGE